MSENELIASFKYSEKRQQIFEACKSLIDDGKNAQKLYSQLVTVYGLNSEGFEIVFAHSSAVLNPLLQVMHARPDKINGLFSLINRMRKDLGHRPFATGFFVKEKDTEAFDRKAYMRELMARKRKLSRRLMDAFNALRSDDNKIKGDERKELVLFHENRWSRVLKEREHAMRLSQGRRLNAEERDAIHHDFWLDVDNELHAFEDFVRAQMKIPVTERAESFRFHLWALGEENV